jgi:hypothetical protein
MLSVDRDSDWATQTLGLQIDYEIKITDKMKDKDKSATNLALPTLVYSFSFSFFDSSESVYTSPLFKIQSGCSASVRSLHTVLPIWKSESGMDVPCQCDVP